MPKKNKKGELQENSVSSILEHTTKQGTIKGKKQEVKRLQNITN